MEIKTDRELTAAGAEISLVRGGPFYRAQQALRLIHPDQWNLRRRIIVLIAVGWLRLLLITAIFNPASLLSLIREYHMYARLLIAVPVLLIGERDDTPVPVLAPGNGKTKTGRLWTYVYGMTGRGEMRHHQRCGLPTVRIAKANIP